MRRLDARLAAGLGFAGAALYVALGLGHPTAYDYYARLADALLHGRWWLTEAPPFLNELIPCGEGRWCVVYGAMPAIVTLPFLAAFPFGTAQTLASAIAGGASAAPGFLALRRLGAPRAVAVSVTAFGVLGTTLLFTSADGRAWYIAHSVAVLFATTALWAAVSGRPAWVVGALLAAGALARFPVALAAPGLAYLSSRARGEPFARSTLLVVFGAAPFAAAELAYDQLRWGEPSELGYALLATGDTYFSRGLFSVEYVPRHLYAMFVQAPDFPAASPFLPRPLWLGTSLVLTSPALFLAARAFAFVRARADVVALAAASLLPLVPDLLHGTVGFAQFGYRYSLDAQPFLLPLVAIGAAWTAAGWRERPGRAFAVLAAYSLFACVYGSIAIIDFGYVG